MVLARVSVHWTGKPWHLRRFLSSSTLSFRLSIFLLFINSRPRFRHRIFFIRRLTCKTSPQFCHWSGKKDDIRQPNGIKDYTRRRWQVTANQLQVWHKIYPLIYKERGEGKKNNTGINFRQKRYHKNRASLQENSLPKRIIDGSEYSVTQYLCIFLVTLGEGAQTCVGSQKPFLWALNGTQCIRPPANKKRRHRLVSVKHPITPQPFASAPSEKKRRRRKKKKNPTT